MARVFSKAAVEPLVYALTISVYCTSWTFLGSVGLASRSGFDFLTIYIGPILVFGLGGFLLSRMVRLAKSQNIASIADFVASRYGKSEAVAATVTIIAVIGVLPYIALQLKAISASLAIIHRLSGATEPLKMPPFGDLSLFVAVLLAIFAIAFGTRRVDTTEHHDGLILAIAIESIVKVVAFVGVGLFVTYGMFDGMGDLYHQAMASKEIRTILNGRSDPVTLAAMIAVSAAAVIVLPRQFHVTVTENRDIKDVRQAAWLFPLYLVIINLFVIPIAVAGLILFPTGTIDRDMTVLALPHLGQSPVVTMMALIGGISAATAMVIVESVSLSIMISNDLVMPVFIKARGKKPFARVQTAQGDGVASGDGQAFDRQALDMQDMGGIVLGVRRIAILALLDARLCLLSADDRGRAGVDRAALLRRHSPDRALDARRPYVAACDGKGRRRRARRRHSRLDLHAPAAKPCRSERKRPYQRAGVGWPLLDCRFEAHGPVRDPALDIFARGARQPIGQYPRLCPVLVAAPADADRTASGQPLRRFGQPHDQPEHADVARLP